MEESDLKKICDEPIPTTISIDKHHQHDLLSITNPVHPAFAFTDVSALIHGSLLFLILNSTSAIQQHSIPMHAFHTNSHPFFLILRLPAHLSSFCIRS